MSTWNQPKPGSRALQYVALGGYLVFLGFPLLWMLSTSLKGPADIGKPDFFPSSPTLDNFIDAIQRGDLLTSARNSLIVAVATMVLVIVVALPAAYALARFKTRLRTVATGWILVSQVFPVVLVIIPLFLILKQFDLDDRLVGLTIVYIVYSLPFGLWMLQGYVASIPVDVEEAGAMDGAGRIRVLRSIVLPLLVPGIVATAMFTLISSWNEFFFALVLIQSPENSTLPLTLARFVGAEGQVQLGALAAGSLLATVPSLIFFALIQRRLTSGLLSGAVKDEPSKTPDSRTHRMSCHHFRPYSQQKADVMRSLKTVGIGATAAALLLAGCATNSSGSEEEEPADAGATSGTDAEPVELRFQSLAFQEPTVAASKKIVDDWNAANPNIQVEYVQGSWDSVHDQLVTQFQGGSAPDIIHDESADMAGFAADGYLADLGPYLSEEVMSSVSEGVWETVTVNDEIIAAPTLLQSYMVFANTDLLEAAGVEIPTGDTWSWDDFQAAAAATTSGEVTGVGWGLKSPTATMMSLGLNFGAQFFEGEGEDATISISDAELELPSIIHEMAYTDGSIDPVSLTQSGGDVMPGFLAGQYAMTVQGSYAAQQLTEQAPDGFNWAVMPPLEGTSAEQSANPQTLSVPAESEHVEQAAAFINYYMEAQNLAAVAQGDWLIPTSSDARETVATDTGGEGGWDQTLKSGDVLTIAPFQKVDSYPQWKDQIATPALQQFFADQIDVDELKAQLTDGWSSLAG